MRADRGGRRPGFSLIEVMTVCVIMGVLSAISVPRFSRAMEQSRANIAVANLRAIWTAQRAFWLSPPDGYAPNTFAPDLATLRSYKLLDGSIQDDPGDGAAVAAGISYVYKIVQTDPSTFQATARRANSTVWTSTLTIDSNGDVTGNVTYVGSSGYYRNDAPIDQFFQ